MNDNIRTWQEVEAALAEGYLYCPDCGAVTLGLIERTEPNGLDREYKEARTCEACENIVYIVRKEGFGE